MSFVYFRKNLIFWLFLQNRWHHVLINKLGWLTPSCFTVWQFQCNPKYFAPRRSFCKFASFAFLWVLWPSDVSCFSFVHFMTSSRHFRWIFSPKSDTVSYLTTLEVSWRKFKWSYGINYYVFKLIIILMVYEHFLKFRQIALRRMRKKGVKVPVWFV